MRLTRNRKYLAGVGLALAGLLAVATLLAGPISAQSGTPAVRLVGHLACILQPPNFCVSSAIIGHTQAGASEQVALDGLLNALPWANLQDADDLDDVGPSDVTGADLVLVSDDTTNDVNKMSLGALRSFITTGLITAGSFIGLTDTPASYSGQNNQLVAVNAAGDGLTFVSAPAPGGSGDITEVTAGTGLTGGGDSGAVTLAVSNPFTAADEGKLDTIGEGNPVWSANITPVTVVRDVEFERRPGQTARGSITGEVNDTFAGRLMRLHLDGDSGALTAITRGQESVNTGNHLRIGTRVLSFSARTLASYNSGSGNTQWDWFGDYSAWLESGKAYSVAILDPADDATEQALLAGTGDVEAARDGSRIDLDLRDSVVVPDDLRFDTGRNIPGNAVVVNVDGTGFSSTNATGPLVVASLPTPLVIGERYLLDTADILHRPAMITALQEQPNLRGLEINVGQVNAIRTYGPTHATVNLRNRAVLSLHGAPEGSIPTHVKLGRTPVTTSYAVSASIVPGIQHTYYISGLTYDSLTPGTTYYVNVLFADGTEVYLAMEVAIGDWTATGLTTLIHTPGIPDSIYLPGNTDPYPVNKLPYQTSPWAQVGNTSRIPASKVPNPGFSYIANNTIGPSRIVSSSSGTYQSDIIAYSAFDMDDVGNDIGVVEAEVIFCLTNRLSNTIAWVAVANQDEASDNLCFRVTDFSNITSIQRTSAYDPAAPTVRYGVVIDNAQVYKGANVIGEVTFYLARNAANQLIVYFWVVGQAGSESYNVNTTMFIAFQHSDSGGGGLPAGGNAGDLLTKSGATDYQVAWTAPPLELREFATFAGLPASGTATFRYASVYNDTTPTLNGIYRWSGTAWVKQNWGN